MQSIHSQLIHRTLRTSNFNQHWQLTGKKLEKRVHNKQKNDRHQPLKLITKQINITMHYLDDQLYYRLSPKESEINTSAPPILYFHGGGYIYTLTPLHWEFLARLVRTTGSIVSVPIYPLAPQNSYHEVFSMAVPLYRMLYTPNLVLMGDSAGGGIALALAHLLNDRGLSQPRRIIALSPALDLSFSNPEIEAMKKNDPVLALPSLTVIADWYRCDLPVTHPLVSPFYADFEKIAPVSLFTGTYDITNPDAKKLQQQLAERQIPFDYREYPKMLHIWMMYYFPEARQAFKEICELILEDTKIRA